MQRTAIFGVAKQLKNKIMACKNCEPYQNKGTMAAHLSDLDKAYDVVIIGAAGAACWGNAVCKTCKTEVEFAFEEFIHAKLFVQVTKNINLEKS